MAHGNYLLKTRKGNLNCFSANLFFYIAECVIRSA